MGHGEPPDLSSPQSSENAGAGHTALTQVADPPTCVCPRRPSFSDRSSSIMTHYSYSLTNNNDGRRQYDISLSSVDDDPEALPIIQQSRVESNVPVFNEQLDLTQSTRTSRITKSHQSVSELSNRRSAVIRLYSDSNLWQECRRPYTSPPRRLIVGSSISRSSIGPHDPWRSASLPLEDLSRTRMERLHSLSRWSSLDNVLAYEEENAEKKRGTVYPRQPVFERRLTFPEHRAAITGLPRFVNSNDASGEFEIQVQNDEPLELPADLPLTVREQSKFRNFCMEAGFIFTIAMTQLLCEFLVSGFAIELQKLSGSMHFNSTSLGIFWPASLLPLILSATLLIFARLSDMHGGYGYFMFGVAWLAIWTLIPGFLSSSIIMDVSRAMQGLAIAAFMPSTFSLVGSLYPEGPRKTFVLGLHAGCAPLGFFAGFLAAGALPQDYAQWYFRIASILSALTVLTAFLSIPSDRTDRRKLDLSMDWIGAILITSDLILVSYALAVEPYSSAAGESGFIWPMVIGPFASGLGCLCIAFYHEGWCATCPLLPLDFFKAKGVKALSLACLCFYASYGVWLYNSAAFFQTAAGHPKSNLALAIRYTPTAVGGIILCIVGGRLMHIVPIMVLLVVSGLAWVASPLLLALAPLPLDYWKFVLPSCVAATLGIDLTFTVSIVWLTSVQPVRYQGLCGAVSSILASLAMSFALSISEIVMKKAQSTAHIPGITDFQFANRFDKARDWGLRATFLYATGSGAAGLIICVLFVRISQAAVRGQLKDAEQSRMVLSESTMADSMVGDAREMQNVVMLSES